MPPVKLHWYDGGLLPERPDDLEPERRLPESGTIFVGRQGQDVVRDLLGEPAPHPGVGDAGLHASAARRCRACRRDAGGHEKNWLDAIRTQGAGGVALRLRRSVHGDACCSATSRCASRASA